MKQYEYSSYSEYLHAQTAANHRKLGVVWAQEANIRYLCSFMGHAEFGICHGTRNGAEQAWFAKYLGCSVIGTEVSDTATRFDSTVLWDFHDPRPEWVGAADFVYSNSLDHAFDPKKAVQTWAGQLRPGGYLLIEHSADCDGEAAVTVHDPFGASVKEVFDLIRPHVKSVFSIALPAKKPAVKELACVIGVR